MARGLEQGGGLSGDVSDRRMGERGGMERTVVVVVDLIKMEVTGGIVDQRREGAGEIYAWEASLGGDDAGTGGGRASGIGRSTVVVTRRRKKGAVVEADGDGLRWPDGRESVRVIVGWGGRKSAPEEMEEGRGLDRLAVG